MQQSYLTQFRPCAGIESVDYAEHLQQGQIARGDAFAAHLATGEALALDQCDVPSGAGELNGRRRACQTRADNDRVEGPTLGGRHGSAPVRLALKQ